MLGGRLAGARPERGDHVRPSPVNRGDPGSKHHLIVEAHGIPLAVTVGEHEILPSGGQVISPLTAHESSPLMAMVCPR